MILKEGKFLYFQGALFIITSLDFSLPHIQIQ